MHSVDVTAGLNPWSKRFKISEFNFPKLSGIIHTDSTFWVGISVFTTHLPGELLLLISSPLAPACEADKESIVY